MNKRVSVSQVFLLRDAMRFKIGNTRGKGEKREENLSGQKHFQMVLDVTHKRKTKQFSCVPAESATRVSPKIVASQKSVPS